MNKKTNKSFNQVETLRSNSRQTELQGKVGLRYMPIPLLRPNFGFPKANPLEEAYHDIALHGTLPPI